MALVRPRLTDFHGVHVAQSGVDFAIPFLDEDIPLYVDPFLLWKSPSLQDQALHTAIINSFNHLGLLVRGNRGADAESILIEASECDEAGLGHSKSRKGQRLGENKAREILELFRDVEQYRQYGFRHIEELQLYVQGVRADRISDLACSFIKSFLVDFTIDACKKLGIALTDVQLRSLYDYQSNKFKLKVATVLPTNPETGEPVVLIPKRWLRHSPWLSFDNYYADYCPMDDQIHPDAKPDPVAVLRYNREHYGAVESYVKARELTQADCHNDPLFTQIPVSSAKRKYGALAKLPTGKTDNADKKFEDYAVQLLASLLYPDLDFAQDQVRTDDGTQIRDLIFYNNRSVDFLADILHDYHSRQIVFELKNVAEINRDHINQLNRYLGSDFGSFGVLVTRNELTQAMYRNTIALWSGQRKCILTLTDEDLRMMVDVFESKQRSPLDILKRRYVEFRRDCPA